MKTQPITYKSEISRYKLVHEPSEIKKTKIVDSRSSFEYIRHFYHEDIEVYESFFMLMMNRANNTIGYVKISQGGISKTVVDMKLVAKYAVDSLASAVIVAHNHPSGQLKPSDGDIRLTKTIKEGLEIFDIVLLDHVILGTDNDYFSFADEGLMF